MKLTFLKRKKIKGREKLCESCGYPATDELGQLVKRVVNGTATYHHFPCYKKRESG